jgi:two-component system cell cycle sensor histidine kinase/response regulator CckA
MSCSETLVLIDHDPSVLALMARLFRSQGYKILEASTAADALRVFEEHRDTIDLVVADVQLSHHGGNLLAKLQSLRPGVRVVYLAASNHMAPADLSRRHTLIPKPFELDVLTSTVRETLDAEMR